jgi:hypothetical protein
MSISRDAKDSQPSGTLTALTLLRHSNNSEKKFSGPSVFTNTLQMAEYFKSRVMGRVTQAAANVYCSFSVFAEAKAVAEEIERIIAGKETEVSQVSQPDSGVVRVAPGQT